MSFVDRRTLGRTGLEVSRLGLASGYGVSAAGIERAFHEYNINYFYWSTPRRRTMRDALRNLAGNHRPEIVIVAQSYDHFGLTVKRAAHKALRSLSVDYIDVLLLGWFNRHPPGGVIEDVLSLKEAGKVRFVAMSGHNRKLFGRMAREADSPVDIYMIRYNAAHRGAEQEIFPYLPESNRPGVTIYTATRWGKLLNPKKMPPGERPMTAAECYRFVLSNPHVDLCMMGPKNEQQMIEGLAALEEGPLPEEEMARAIRIGDYVHG